MHIHLNNDQENFVASLLGSGEFTREEDVLLAGLEELRQKQARHLLQREIFERDIAPALRQLEAGQGREINVETFIAQRTTM